MRVSPPGRLLSGPLAILASGAPPDADPYGVGTVRAGVRHDGLGLAAFARARGRRVRVPARRRARLQPELELLSRARTSAPTGSATEDDRGEQPAAAPATKMEPTKCGAADSYPSRRSSNTPKAAAGTAAATRPTASTRSTPRIRPRVFYAAAGHRAAPSTAGSPSCAAARRATRSRRALRRSRAGSGLRSST